MCCRNQYISLSPLPRLTQILPVATRLAQMQAARSAERQLAENSPSLPPWLCLHSAQIIFPFWVFRALIAEGWVGGWRQPAVCREVEKGGGVVGEPRRGWKCAMCALLREKENLALWGRLG